MPRAVGRSVLRKEDRRLLMGRGKYAADFRAPRMLHAALLRSPHAHARLGAVRTDAALGLPGVVAVVTAGDLGDIGRIPTRLGHRIGNVACLQRPLARDCGIGAPASESGRYVKPGPIPVGRGAAGPRNRPQGGP